MLIKSTQTVAKIIVCIIFQRLSQQLEVMVEERAAIENKAELMMAQIKDMSSEATQIEDEIHKMQIEELQVQLQSLQSYLE